MKCFLFDGCPGRTGVCYSCGPDDDGCPVYRWFKDKALKEQPQWISVKDRLPENEVPVIGYTPCDGYMFVGFYRTHKFGDDEWNDWYIITAMRSTKKMKKKVTHWMPLPEVPKKEKTE